MSSMLLVVAQLNGVYVNQTLGATLVDRGNSLCLSSSSAIWGQPSDLSIQLML